MDTKMSQHKKFTNEKKIVNLKNLVLFGVDSTVITDNIFDLIILLAKQYLYRCKLEQSVPLVSVFRKQLKLRYKSEEYNSKITFKENAFNARWHCY